MENLEIATIAKQIETGIATFEKRKAELVTLVSGYDSLAIKDHTDKAGYKAVSEARKSLKVERVQIEKEGKSMRDPLTAMSKYVIEKEKELIAITEPAEKSLFEKEKWYEAENERIKREAEEKEAARIQDMADQLTAYNFPFNIEQLKTVTEEQFQEALAFAKEAFEKKEAERIAFEKEEADRKAAEEEQLRKDRQELEKLRAEQAETARKQAEAQALIDAEQKRIEEEKKAIELQKQKEAEEKARQEQIEKAKAEAAERARIEAISEAKKAEEDRIEAERLAKIEEERQAALRPDKEKLQAFAVSLSEIKPPTVSQESAQVIVNDIQVMIDRMKAHILKKIKDL